MKSINEIIIAVKESQPVTDEELRLALLSVDSLRHFAENSLRKLSNAVLEKKSEQSISLQARFAKDMLDRRFVSFKMPPRQYLGESNIPGNPEYKKRYSASKKLLDKFLEKQSKEDNANENVPGT